MTWVAQLLEHLSGDKIVYLKYDKIIYLLVI